MKKKLLVQNPTPLKDTCSVGFFVGPMLDYIIQNKGYYNIEWHTNGHLSIYKRNGC